MKYFELTCTFLFSYGILNYFLKKKNKKEKENKSILQRVLYFFSNRIEGENDNDRENREKENKKWLNDFIFKLISFILISYFINDKINEYLNPPIELSINKLNNQIVKNISKVEIFEDKFAYLFTNNSIKYKYFIEILSRDIIEKKLKNNKNYENIDIFYRNKKVSFSNYISLAFNIFYFYIIYYSIKNVGRIMNQDDNKKVIQLDTNVKEKLDNVAGLEETKRDILEFIDFFKNREKYLEVGARMPRGALFYGPPGTGKTLMAKAIAGECNIPFISVSGSDFSEIFVGVGSARVRNLFKIAREKAPCIVFIDEIDALAKVRGNKFGGGNDDKENTLNRLLIELDGFDDNDNIMVFGATNRKDTLDKALLRPGRFDRKIEFYLPEKKDRKEILNYYLKDLEIEGNLEELIENISEMTYGFSPAELSNICNEASIISIRKNKNKIDMNILNEAIEYTIIGPERKSRCLNDEEKNIVAHHESGHAFMSYCLKNTELPIKVSIIPRGNSALGFSMSKLSDKKLMKKKDLFNKMCVLIGGRVSEEVFFNEITNGAYDDIEKLTNIARNYVKLFGMDNKMGYINYDYNLKYGMMIKDYSDITNKKIDDSIKKLVDQVYSKTLELITNHKEEVEKLSNLLLNKETLQTNDLKKILGNELLNKY